ncbi:MAG: hypothetical protein AB9903_30750 [Vulcanimicrobiota bacterium]
MTKKELIEGIQEAIRTEESASAVYLKHIKALIERAGCKETCVSEVKALIDTLVSENTRHKKILKELLVMIGKEDCDVY